MEDNAEEIVDVASSSTCGSAPALKTHFKRNRDVCANLLKAWVAKEERGREGEGRIEMLLNCVIFLSIFPFGRRNSRSVSLT